MQRLIAAFAALAVTGSAVAHTAWLEPAAGGTKGEYRVMFGGHAGKLEPYTPEKVKAVEAWDARGAQLATRREVTPEGVVVRVDGAPALVAMHFDNGFHTRPATGPSVPKPMNEVPGAVSGTHAVKYHKTIDEWAAPVRRPLGQPFEVVPLDEAAPRAGQPMRVQVLLEGKPVAGVRLGQGEEPPEGAAVTDAQGIASFVPQAGFNRLWAGKRIKVSGHPQYTELSYEYSLGFEAR
jgi:nickel transport protein